MLLKKLSPGAIAEVKVFVDQLTRARIEKWLEVPRAQGPHKARMHSEIAKLTAALDLTAAIAKTGIAPIIMDPTRRNQLRMVRTRAKALAATTADRLANASRAGNAALARTLSNDLTQLNESIRQIDEIVGAEEPPAQLVRQRR